MAETYANDNTWNVVEDHVILALQADTDLKAGGGLAIATWEQELPEDAGVYQANLLPAVAVEVIQQRGEADIGFPDRVDQTYAVVVVVVVAGGELRQVKLRTKEYLSRVVRVLQQQHHTSKQLSGLPAALSGGETGSVRVWLTNATLMAGHLESGGGLRGIAEISADVVVGMCLPED